MMHAHKLHLYWSDGEEQVWEEGNNGIEEMLVSYDKEDVGIRLRGGGETKVIWYARKSGMKEVSCVIAVHDDDCTTEKS